MEAFEKLGVSWGIVEEINKRGFTKPTEIQKKAIPWALKNKNVIVAAPTGSGKTLVYGVRVIQNSSLGKGLQNVVVVPTRELANQVQRELQTFAELRHLKVLSIATGTPTSAQYDKILESEILIATPGKLIDHIEKNGLNLTNIKTLVLDEADTLISTEFKEQTIKIIEKIPRTRQTILTSATINQEVAKLCNKYMRNPVKVFAGTQVDSKKLKQCLYEVEAKQKLSLLIHLLNKEQAGLTMIFTNRTETAEFVGKNIKKFTNLKVGVIHGDLGQGKRNKIISEFSDEKMDILVATDIAARGLDFENITHIYNYNIPAEDKKYIHRIGRTARAGRTGKVINLVGEKDVNHLINIMKENKISIMRQEVPKNLEIIEAVAVENSKKNKGKN